MAGRFIYFDGAQRELGLVPVEAAVLEAMGSAAGVALVTSVFGATSVASGSSGGLSTSTSVLQATATMTAVVQGAATTLAVFRAAVSLGGAISGLATVTGIGGVIPEATPMAPSSWESRRRQVPRAYYLRYNNGELTGPYNMREANMIARRMSSPRYGSYFVEAFKELVQELDYPDRLVGQYELVAVYINGQKKASGEAAKQLSKFHLGVDR